MPLETGTYISDLVSSNPAHTDSLNNADAHMRLIKSTLQATFPSLSSAVTGPITGGGYQWLSADGTPTQPSYSFASEPTLGFYRYGARKVRLVGGRLIGGAPVGSLHFFVKPPFGLGSGGTGTGWEFLELDGSVWNTADFPDLAEHLGATGSTFTLDNVRDTGRFLRSRTSTLAARTTQAYATAAHSHTVSGTTGTQNASHTHYVTGTTNSMNRNATHTHTVSGGIYGGTSTDLFSEHDVGAPRGAQAITINAANTDHEHTFGVFSGAENQNHAHSFSATTSSNGDTETRPEALAVIMCIKT